MQTRADKHGDDLANKSRSFFSPAQAGLWALVAAASAAGVGEAAIAAIYAFDNYYYREVGLCSR
jgi:hypothetical protein